MHDILVTGSEKQIAFEIPILHDMYGLTALDICLCIDKPAEIYSRIFYADNTRKTLERGTENLTMADCILRTLQYYGFMHSSY